MVIVMVNPRNEGYEKDNQRRNGFVKTLFFKVIRLFSAAAMKVTPSHQGEGGSQGETAPFPFFWLDFSTNLLMIIEKSGGCPGGMDLKHTVQRALKSDCLFLLRISTEP